MVITEDKVKLDEHIEADHGTIAICGECGDSFPNQEVCEDHKKSKHTIEDRIELVSCKSCDLVCGDLYALKSHVEEHHVSNVYTCNSCNYETNVNTELWRHKVNEHNIIPNQTLEQNELFMNVLAKTQEFIIQQIENLEKRLCSEMKDILTNQSQIYEKVKVKDAEAPKHMNPVETGEIMEKLGNIEEKLKHIELKKLRLKLHLLGKRRNYC